MQEQIIRCQTRSLTVRPFPWPKSDAAIIRVILRKEVDSQIRARIDIDGTMHHERRAAVSGGECEPGGLIPSFPDDMLRGQDRSSSLERATQPRADVSARLAVLNANHAAKKGKGMLCHLDERGTDELSLLLEGQTSVATAILRGWLP